MQRSDACEVGPELVERPARLTVRVHRDSSVLAPEAKVAFDIALAGVERAPDDVRERVVVDWTDDGQVDITCDYWRVRLHVRGLLVRARVIQGYHHPRRREISEVIHDDVDIYMAPRLVTWIAVAVSLRCHEVLPSLAKGKF
jgi:hypothetical protein